MKKKLLDKYKTFETHRYLYEFVPLFLLVLLISLIYSFLFKVYPLAAMQDAFRYNGYQMYIIKYSLIQYGQFALWDQLLSAGMSWISHPGGPLFFPTTWIIIFLIDKFSLGSVMLFFFHLLSGAAAFYFLLRVLGMRKITSFFVSISYITTQYVFIFLISGWFEELFGLTLLPLTAGLLMLALSRNNYWYAVLGGMVMSMNFFGNTYYVFHYNAIVVIWIALVLVRNKLYSRELLSYILINGLFWLTFVLTASVKLLPLLEFRNLSSRNVLPLSAIETSDAVMTFSFFFNRIRNFLFPIESFSGISKHFFQLGNDIAIILVFVSFIYALIRKNSTYILFTSLLLIGAWGYLANRLPLDLYAFFYQFLPGFNSNQFPYRFMIIINLAFFVCLALGFNILLKRKKRFIIMLGYFIGLIFIVNGFLFTSISFKNNNLQRKFNIENELKKPLTFNIEKKDLNSPPKIIGKINTNLLTVLIQIVKKYRNEGRIHSTFFSGDNVITSDQLLLGELQSVQNSYDAIVPSYQYGIIRNLDSSKDSLDTFTKQFKIYSILNTKFHLQQKEYSEYENCYTPASLTDENDKSNIVHKKSQEQICKFLAGRLSKILTDNDGSIYYDKEVLPRVALIKKAILLISDNRFNDYSGFIAKKIMFHPDFDEKRVSIFSGASSYLNNYTLEEIKKFSAVFVVDAKIDDKDSINKLFNNYEKSGGIVLNLSSNYISYESLHKRSLSIWTDTPAWSYTKEDEMKLSEVLRALNKDDIDIGNVIINKFTPEDLIFKVFTNNDKVALQYSDSFFPGWKATIDDKPTQVYMADGLVKGIIIPNKGVHTIRFYYAPDSFKNGALISLTTLLLLTGVGVTRLYKRRQVSN